MRKILYILIPLLILFGIFFYRSYNDNCYDVCKSPQKRENFKNLNIESQYQTYLKCNCRFDSEPARQYWGWYIAEKDQSIEFLSDKLRNENNEDVLTETLYILRDSTRQQDIKGRSEILNLVKQIVDKISDKDERSRISKILGDERISRKEGLEKILTEIKERTQMSKDEYQEKWEKEIQEETKRKIKEAVDQIVKEKQFDK